MLVSGGDTTKQITGVTCAKPHMHLTWSLNTNSYTLSTASSLIMTFT